LTDAAPSGGAGLPAGGRPPVSGVRVGVGLLLAVVAVLVILLDGLLAHRGTGGGAAPGTGLLIAALSATALLEFYALLGAAGIPSLRAYGAGASFVLLAGRALLPWTGVRPADAAALAEVGLLLAALLPVARAIAVRRRDGTGDALPADLLPLAGTALGLVFVHLPMAFLLELRLVPEVPGMSTSVPHGLVLAGMVVVGCKVGDSAAYFAGRTVGRTPLCWVSPKKTWEGAAAGLLAGTAAACAIGCFAGLDVPRAAGFGLVVNLAGQGGDLLESWFKRAAGAKDSGRTFGEMGGALDLIDALLLAGPAGYACSQVVLG
jgi:phosphatidate cytidylyltransferase